MFVARRSLQVAQEEAGRLQRELALANASLAQYKQQERELIDAVVAARVEARAVRNHAEKEAGAVLEGARDQAESITAQARTQLAAAHTEIARLREVQRELSASLEQSLATLRSVLGNAPFPPPSQSDQNQPTGDQTVRAPEPSALPRTGSDRRDSVRPPPQHAPPRDRICPPLIAPGGPPVDKVAVTPLGFSGHVAKSATHPLLALRANPRLLKMGGLALICLLVVGTGATRWLRRVAAGRGATIASQTGLPHTAGQNTANNLTVRTPANQANARPHGARIEPQIGTPRVSVALTAVRPVWVRAQVDGKEALARLVRAGEGLDFRGAHDVVLRAGDAGALMMSVNGAAAAVLGGDGAVVTRRVTAGRAGRPAAGVPAEALRVAQGSTTALGPPTAAVPSVRLPAARQLRTVDAVNSVRPVEPLQTPAPPALTGPPSTVSLDSTDEGDVLRGHEAYFEALRRGDRGQMGRLLAEGFSATGAAAVDESGIPYEISLRNASVEVRGVGAVVSGTASQRIRGPEGQFLRDEQLLFSEVWIKRSGQWQLMNVRLVSQGPTP
jgi:hypothetical protein